MTIPERPRERPRNIVQFFSEKENRTNRQFDAKYPKNNKSYKSNIYYQYSMKTFWKVPGQAPLCLMIPTDVEADGEPELTCSGPRAPAGPPAGGIPLPSTHMLHRTPIDDAVAEAAPLPS